MSCVSSDNLLGLFLLLFHSMRFAFRSPMIICACEPINRSSRCLLASIFKYPLKLNACVFLNFISRRATISGCLSLNFTSISCFLILTLLTFQMMICACFVQTRGIYTCLGDRGSFGDDATTRGRKRETHTRKRKALQVITSKLIANSNGQIHKKNP